MSVTERAKRSATDQVRRHLLAPGAQPPVTVANPLLIGPVMSGGGYYGGGGYDMIAGLVEGDQPFTIDIFQGATFAGLTRVEQLVSELTGGFYTCNVRWPLCGEWIYIVVTDTGGVDMTFTFATLYLMPHASDLAGWYANHPRHVQSSDVVGAAPGFNPFVGAGVNGPAGNVTRMNVADLGGTYDPLVVTISGGGAALLAPYTDDDTAPTTGLMAGGLYQAVKRALEDGDAGHLSINAYGDLEIAGYSRPLGALQVSEIAPAIYDVQSGTARASAALPAAGAYDAAAIEIPCAGLRNCILDASYTRAAAGGSCGIRLQKCLTIGGVDYWYDAIIQNPAVFAAGADSQINIQRARPYVYQATGAGAELYGIEIDNLRCDKIRFPAAEIGAIANPGTLVLYYKLSN